jgi:hypothetical protein
LFEAIQCSFLTRAKNTLEKVFMKCLDSSTGLDRRVVFQQLLWTENAPTGFSFAWNVGAVGDNDRVHLSGHGGLNERKINELMRRGMGTNAARELKSTRAFMGDRS